MSDSMEHLIAEFVEQPIWAVAGFSLNRRKYGNLIYHDMKQAGYVVFPVNRNGGAIDGAKIYPSVLDLPIKVGVVDVVVPPHEAIQIARDCLEAGLERIWLQPGAESGEVIDYCRQHKLKVVYHACAMVEKRLLGR